jgi:lipoprotein-anchoring transpeptidase ErfK/SrfK
MLLAAAISVGSGVYLSKTSDEATAPAPMVSTISREAGDLDAVRMLDESTPEEIANRLGFDDDAEATFDRVAVVAPLVTIDVNISTQRMTISTPQGTLGPWKVSTAGPGYKDAVGIFPINPKRMHKMYNSVQYDGAPMPFAQFYTGGYAVHATYATKHLGRPASHGCVRLSPKNAESLFNVTKPIIEAYGAGSVVIHVHR